MVEASSPKIAHSKETVGTTINHSSFWCIIGIERRGVFTIGKRGERGPGWG